MNNNVAPLKAKNILIAAGGTGGHIFPADALAERLKARGHNVYFATDVRGLRFAKNLPANEVTVISGATVFSKSPWSILKSIFKIIFGIVQSLIYVFKNDIDIVVGFGGYPSFAPLLAGKILFRPSVLHEQNAVLGRANRLLAKFTKQVALSFPKTKYAEDIKHKTTFIGNPLRGIVRDLTLTDYAPYTGDGYFNLVIFGGSQGAKILSDILPEAIERLPDELRSKLNIIQQVHKNDVASVSVLYDEMGIKALIAPFFENMPKLIADSHLVIGRAGATTVAELSYIGRPSLLVPLPGALDADQANNAKNIADIGGGWLCEQRDFNPQYLEQRLIEWFEQPNILADAAKNAKNLGQPNAADNLATLVEEYIR